MVEATVGKRKRQIGPGVKGKKGKKISREAKRKAAQRRAEEDAEEARFRDLVFGKSEGELLKALGTEVPETEPSSWPEDEARIGDAMVTARKGRDGGRADKGTGGDAATGEEEEEEGEGDGPAWVDEDDADLRVDISAKNRLRKLRNTKKERKMSGAEFEKRLRSRFAGSNLSTGWARSAEEDALKAARGEKPSRKTRTTTGSGYYSSGDEEEVMDVEELLRDTSPLTGDQGQVLQSGSLDIVRLRDANQQEPAKSVVRAVSFHPTGELLLAGGFDKTLRLFQVDGVRNNKVHSIFFDDLPISNAVFTANDQAIVTGRRPYFYWYDVPTGKVQKVPRLFSSGRAEKLLETFAASPDGKWLAFVGSKGYVLLVSNHTKQWVTDFKLNCAAKTITFTADSQFLMASGADGDVYKFDVRSRRCVLRFFNEGGTCTTSLAVSGSTSHRFSAVGSASGVVNVYDDGALEMGRGVLRPSPLKAVMNLTTPVTTAKFSPDGQILAIASSEKRDAFKMVHSRSCSVFTNWPTERTPVRRPYSLDFSPGGGFLAIGNDRGCVLLYRLRHYPQA